MELYLVRHAESKSKEEDPERGLTDIGIANIRIVAGVAKSINIILDTIFHSDKSNTTGRAGGLRRAPKRGFRSL